MTNDPTRDLSNRFTYRVDVIDRWTLLDAPDGPLIGDCEDFSLTALWLISGRSWGRLWWLVLTCQAVLWHGDVRGAGHVMPWVRGRGWIDNINKDAWSIKPIHPRKFPYLAPVLVLVLLMKRGA